jgi:valyl-tRNA synthetase
MGLPKAYEPKKVEEKCYSLWEDRKYFGINEDSDAEAFGIVIPPPNVTGVLHMGHALVNVLQDVLVRWKRMSGYEALWVPGTDHAGIATQTVVERHLIATQGKRRVDFERGEFIRHVWQWKKNNEARILQQLKRVGCSCDWSRQRFTMDEGCNKAVRTMFKKMFDEGLIYQGDYLVNWDPVTQTALADDEVEYEEKKSFLWYFKYPIKDSNDHVVIATTRPETMLGDTAVAVSPKDERYKHLIGQHILLPITHREIPIIADDFVDPEFGTGVVKVTPAHDPNDYQMGLRHDLEFINIMTPDAKINENGGKFAGMKRENARIAVVDRMKDQGLLERVEPHTHRVGVSYRSKAVIEPYLSKQWFIRMEPFRDKLKSVVQEGRVKIIPKNWENTYFHWIDNLRDWCISRQLWWGHRIPIWYHRDDPDRMICYEGEGTPPEVEASPGEWYQDEDVLDTWFSSALWPFSALGWPEKSRDVARFYPNSVLITGYDILFFWVARMILMGEYAMEEPPFPEVFLHGLIYGKSYWRNDPEHGGIIYVDEEERLAYDLGTPTPKGVFSRWEKMSKSKGNIIDPLEIIDQYGTDAMRMALCASASHASQIDLDRRRFEEFKNFANKIWNGARFVFMNLEADEEGTLPALTTEGFSKGLDEGLFTLDDKWILSAMGAVVKEVNRLLTEYSFDQAAMAAYDFFWKEYCSYYVEVNKPFLFGREGTPEVRENKQKLLVIVLCSSLRLMHPMAPFITEEIFQLLKERFAGVTPQDGVDPYTAEAVKALTSDACIIAPYPKVLRESDIDTNVNEMFSHMEEAVYTIRNIRGEMALQPSVKTDVHIVGPAESTSCISDNISFIKALVRVENLNVSTEVPNLPFSSMGVVGDIKIIIPLPEELREKERIRLEKEVEKLVASIERLTKQLANEAFVARAPKVLVEKNRLNLEKQQQELDHITEKLAGLNASMKG